MMESLTQELYDAALEIIEEVCKTAETTTIFLIVISLKRWVEWPLLSQVESQS